MFAYGWKLTAVLVLTLKYCYNVQRVAVLQILHWQWPRRRIRYPVDIPWFNDRVDTLNIFLRNYFKEDNQELVYTDDGVHLNEVYGYPKYYNSVRAAVVSLLK
jgi:hypothetical protein